MEMEIPAPAWTTNAKGHVCATCPNMNSKCLLKGRRSPNARVTFVMESPGHRSNNAEDPLHNGDQAIGVFFKLITDLIAKRGGAPLPYNVVYLVGATGKNASKEVIAHCKSHMEKKLDQHRAAFDANPTYDHTNTTHVLVPMGATTSKHFVRGNVAMNNMRGNQYLYPLNGREYQVMPTLSLSHILAQPGVARIVRDDIDRAFTLAEKGTLDPARPIEEIARDYLIPTTIEEVERVCDLIIGYHDPEKGRGPDTWPISVDTETNTVKPYEPDARVIMVSFAWDDGQATAITLDHPESPYGREEAWQHVRRVLASPKPKIFHNAKFDWQMLAKAAESPIENIWWDTMLSEHFMDESKKGFYGLKTVVDLYAPSYRGYEEKLKKALAKDPSMIKVEGIPAGQEGPDPSKSWALSPFFPLLAYPSACESPAADGLGEADRLELFNLEFAYLWAHSAEDKDAKSKARGRIRTRCKKWGLEPPPSVKAVKFGGDDRGFESIPLPILTLYAGADADVTRIICKRQRRRLRKDEEQRKDMTRVMSTLQIPMTPTLGRMEFEGTKLNLEEVDRYEREIGLLAEDTLLMLKDFVTEDGFNPSSNQQLAEVIGEGKAIPLDHEDMVFTEDGNLSVRTPWMELIRDNPKYRGEVTGNFFENLMIYRGASKAVGSFIKNLKKLSAIDGRIHTRFGINGTATGRLSSSQLNLQNIPLWMCRFSRTRLDGAKQVVTDDLGRPQSEVLVPGWNIKKLFVPTDPDEQVFFQLDIAAAEVRVLCAYAQDGALIEALEQGLDIHSFIASKIFDPSYEEFMAGKDSDPHIKHLRTAAKRVVFGTLYGAGGPKIASQIYGGLSADPVEREKQIDFAEETINLLFRRFDRIGNYVNGTHLQVKNDGFVRTFFGRRRRFNMQDASWKLRSAAQREAVNFKIQSTSSDLVVSQLVEVDEHAHEIGARVLLTVHDSLAGEIQRSKVPQMVEFFDHWIVERIRERFPWMPVPFNYDLEVGPNYGELADIGALKLAEKPSEELTEGEVKFLKKSRPILEAAGLWPAEVRDAS